MKKSKRFLNYCKNFFALKSENSTYFLVIIGDIGAFKARLQKIAVNYKAPAQVLYPCAGAVFTE